jgi:hypothetical protein
MKGPNFKLAIALLQFFAENSHFSKCIVERPSLNAKVLGGSREVIHQFDRLDLSNNSGKVKIYYTTFHLNPKENTTGSHTYRDSQCVVYTRNESIMAVYVIGRTDDSWYEYRSLLP